LSPRVGLDCSTGCSDTPAPPAHYSGRVPRIFSDLNLNGPTPPRVQPVLGEWGPVKVPTTRQKKRMRIWVGLVLLGAMIAIFLLGWFVYHAMTGSWGFGIGEAGQLLRWFG
jgi:hypothetical protein